MPNESHWMTRILCAHLLDAGTEARNRQDNDIPNFLMFCDAKKIGIGDIAVPGTEIEECWIVKVGKYRVRPQCGTSEFNNALGQFAHLQHAVLLHP